jgi:hypothetical protein
MAAAAWATPGRNFGGMLLAGVIVLALVGI